MQFVDYIARRFMKLQYLSIPLRRKGNLLL